MPSQILPIGEPGGGTSFPNRGLAQGRAEPDLEGFAEAMDRKRILLGEDVIFLSDAVVSFPPGTPLDPESGVPLDPLVEATASAQASAGVRASVYFRAVTRGGGGGSDSADTPAGRGEHTHVMLILPPAGASAASGCGEFVLRGERYLIDSQKLDAPVRGADRWLVYGAEEEP